MDLYKCPKVNLISTHRALGHQWSVSNADKVSLPPILGCSLRGPQGGGSYWPAWPFSDLFFILFSNTLLGTIWEPLDAILVYFGCHFASILDTPGHKNEGQNATPSSTGPNPEFAYGYTLFIIFMIPKAAEKEPKWNQNRAKIDGSRKICSWSYFFHLLLNL